MTDGYKDLVRQTAEIELAMRRNDFLDAFADVEAEIAGMLNQGGKLKSGTPFHARIDAFRTLEGIPKIAGAHLPKRDVLADRIASLLPLRADIVHSRMTVCIVDGSANARFINVQNRHERHPTCRLLGLTDFQSATQELAKIRDGLKALNLVSPASSQPLPSQGAAGDP